MVTTIVSVCLLITPFIIVFLHSSIIHAKHYENIYANYFIISNKNLYTLINSYVYLAYGDSMSKFQGWIFTPAVFHIGIFQLTLFLFSILALLKNNQFKAACLIFFCYYTILNSPTLFSGSVYNSVVEVIFFVNIAAAVIAYVLYKVLSRKV